MSLKAQWWHVVVKRVKMITWPSFNTDLLLEMASLWHGEISAVIFNEQPQKMVIGPHFHQDCFPFCIQVLKRVTTTNVEDHQLFSMNSISLVRRVYLWIPITVITVICGGRDKSPYVRCFSAQERDYATDPSLSTINSSLHYGWGTYSMLLKQELNSCSLGCKEKCPSVWFAINVSMSYYAFSPLLPCLLS